MPYTQVANLDFEDIKVALKDYLRAQSDFTDYDFEGSALSTLIDTCLLYTSPSPRDQRGSRMPSSA